MQQYEIKLQFVKNTFLEILLTWTTEYMDITAGVDFINPFTLYAKLLRSAPNFYTLKKLLEIWLQSVRAWRRA